MSNRHNQITLIWKDVEQFVRRTTVQRLSIPLKGADLRTAQDALLLWEMALVDLTTPFGSPPEWNPLEHIRFVVSLDLITLVGLLKSADTLLLLNCIEDSPSDYDDFKHRLEAENWVVDGIFHPLRGLIEQWHKDHATDAFRLLHNAFVFLSRLSLRDVPDLEDKAMQDYLAHEYRISTVVPTTEEADIITKWFPRVGDVRYSPIYKDVVCKHGPGAVADAGRSLSEKYKKIGTDIWTDYLDQRMDPPPSTPRPRCEFERTSKVVFVPKSVTSLRTICMEPTTLQWYQQGFFKSLSRYIRNHRYLKRRISLENQEYNRELAFVGSIDGSFSTIDLTAASDSVSWRLVKAWFQRSVLRETFWSCRSKNALLPNGDVIRLHKFAPMGSALCFPVECLVFAAIVEASIKEVGGRPHESQYRVYGDDIIVESEYAETVVSRLIQNGFIPNKDKSYTYTKSSLIYRESCGGEYLNGDDVTPIRLSRWFAGLTFSVSDASTIERLISFANDCYGHLPTVRLCIIRCLDSLRPGYKVPFSDSGDVGLFSPTPTNYRIKTVRYSDSFQEPVYRAGGLKTTYPQHDPAEEDIRLFEYLRVNETRSRLLFPEDRTEVRLSLPRYTKWSSRNYFDLHP